MIFQMEEVKEVEQFFGEEPLESYPRCPIYIHRIETHKLELRYCPVSWCPKCANRSCKVQDQEAIVWKVYQRKLKLERLKCQ